MVPRISRVAVLRDADSEGAAISFKEYEAAARALKIPLQSLEVRGPNPDLEGAFQAAVKGRASALITITSSLALSSPEANCRPSDKEPTAIDVPRKYLGRVWRPRLNDLVIGFEPTGGIP